MSSEQDPRDEERRYDEQRRPIHPVQHQQRPWRYVLRDAALVGLVQAIVLVLVIYIAVALSGNRQVTLLNDIRSAIRANVCVLVLPVGEDGRSEAATNSRCLIPNGIQPIDANDDGVIDTERG